MGNEPARESQHKSKPGLQRIYRALDYSMDGLAAAYKHESAFRQELWLAAVLLAVAVILPLSLVHTVLLWLVVVLVLIVELVNSAIEAVVDRISLDNHALAKRAKDIGSAAVFLALTNCVVVWALVLFDAFG